MRFFILVGLFIFSSFAHARVRTLTLDDTKMYPVFLKLGKSTVLRFNERPTKVVIGNKNYFNLEFIENDLAIQPLGVVNTNIFIYTKPKTYGMMLKVGSGNYDDLVKVRWKIPSSLKSRTKIKNKIISSKIKVTKLEKSLSLNDHFDVKLKRLIFHHQLKSYFIDFDVKNTSKKNLTVSTGNIFLSRKRVALKGQRLILYNNPLPPGKSTKGRIIFKQDKKMGFSFEVKTKDRSKRHIIPRTLL